MRVAARHHGLGDDGVWHVGDLSPTVTRLPPLARVVQDLQHLSSGVGDQDQAAEEAEEVASARSACGKWDFVSIHVCMTGGQESNCGSSYAK